VLSEEASLEADPEQAAQEAEDASEESAPGAESPKAKHRKKTQPEDETETNHSPKRPRGRMRA
jgi:hypothetical protein